MRFALFHFDYLLSSFFLVLVKLLEAENIAYFGKRVVYELSSSSAVLFFSRTSISPSKVHAC